MNHDFGYWKKQFDNDRLKEFNHNPNGILWLKIKSICRREYIGKFIAANNLNLKDRTFDGKSEKLYTLFADNIEKYDKLLNDFIEKEHQTIVDSLDTDALIQELYKVDAFKWSADNQNNLGTFLVKKYVKENKSYDFLINKMGVDIIGTVHDYLVCSWYNHCSSALIEHVFKKHEDVLPAIGKIKSIDFFINGIPFDLKVTYLPVNFIDKERKKANLRSELDYLKEAAKRAKIKFNDNDEISSYSLTKQLTEKGGDAANAVNEIRDFRLKLVEKVKKKPLLLAKNLYENQSNFRFGAENRIFLILIDRENFDNSWQLKRNIDLLTPAIHNYLDNFKSKNLDKLKLKFHKEGKPKKYPKKYEVLTDVIIVEK